VRRSQDVHMRRALWIYIIMHMSNRDSSGTEHARGEEDCFLLMNLSAAHAARYLAVADTGAIQRHLSNADRC